MTANQKEKYEGMGTKVSPAMAEVINTICDSLGVDVYHLLQQFLYTLVRAAGDHHNMSPEIQRIMTIMETDSGWQNAFNLCNPDGLEVAQVVLILQQRNRKGFGAVMIDKAMLPGEEPRQTENVDDILERVTEVCMRGIYRRLQLLGARMGCNNLSDILLTMIDAQAVIEMDEENRREMQGRNDIADNGRPYAYGKRTKAKQHRTPDSEARRQQRIQFGDADTNTANSEANNWDGEIRQTDPEPSGFRPHGEEW